jgi:hypothetical protein
MLHHANTVTSVAKFWEFPGFHEIPAGDFLSILSWFRESSNRDFGKTRECIEHSQTFSTLITMTGLVPPRITTEGLNILNLFQEPNGQFHSNRVMLRLTFSL